MDEIFLTFADMHAHGWQAGNFDFGRIGLNNPAKILRRSLRQF
jgi:hypothetical protein